MRILECLGRLVLFYCVECRRTVDFPLSPIELRNSLGCGQENCTQPGSTFAWVKGLHKVLYPSIKMRPSKTGKEYV